MNNTNNAVQGYAATAIQTWTMDMAAIADRRAKLSEKYGATHMTFVANLICFAAAGWFIKDDKAAYNDKLGKGFQSWLMDNCKMKEKQAAKYGSAVSAALHIRKTKADKQLVGLRTVAINEGPDAVLTFLEKVGANTFNKFITMVQPGTRGNVVAELLKRVANLPETERDDFMAKIKGEIAKAKADADKAAKAKASTVVKSGSTATPPSA